MLQSVLLFLVGLPMLMPPGMCVCQFGICHGVPSAPELAEADPALEPDARCCCASRAARDATIPAGSKALPILFAGGPKSHRLPGQHTPGCPASLGPVMARTAILAAPVAVPAVPQVSMDFVSASSAEPLGTTAHLPPSIVAPPLYLSHCTFVI